VLERKVIVHKCAPRVMEHRRMLCNVKVVVSNGGRARMFGVSTTLLRTAK
jgi:hypothetical protein